MSVSAVASTQATNAATASAVTNAAASSTMNYNQFLTLLMTQLKYQDPTAPMDPTAQLSQLAQFSAVEQQVQTNATLTSLLNNTMINQAEAAIGRTVTSADGSISGRIVSVTINASGSTATLNNGKTVTLGTGVTIS
jgi:flagellar basal-body rod modification protein FlgD